MPKPPPPQEKEPEYKGVPLRQLVAQLKSPDAQTRKEAAKTIGLIGPAAKDAVPALVNALKDKDSDVRSSAALALKWIGPAAEWH
ncbi:MAG TPA: HEAT repeat domain-containing protein [Gemmataceae bacterium]|nr:HEAT repeat domain-containing protein [Gemmataceae bacterium]